MSQLKILTDKERADFNSPPHLSLAEREQYFSISTTLQNELAQLKTTTSKVGFIIQYGYFKAIGQFFTTKNFIQSDIKFVTNLLGFKLNFLKLDTYKGTLFKAHQIKILNLLGYKKFDKRIQMELEKEIQKLASKQMRPKQIMMVLINQYREDKIEVPTYNTFAALITKSYNDIENEILDIINKHLNKKQVTLLDKLMPFDAKKNQFIRAKIVSLKHINQSTRPAQIKKSVQEFISIKSLYKELYAVIEKLNLSQESIKYYAVWVYKARTSQLQQFTSPTKRHLYLLSFVMHQYRLRQDTLLDIYLKALQATLNKTMALQKEENFLSKDKKNESIALLATTHWYHRSTIKKIKEIIQSSQLTNAKKVSAISKLVNGESEKTYFEIDQVVEELERTANNSLGAEEYLDFLEKQSIELQRRVSPIISNIDFHYSNSNVDLNLAIQYFQEKSGALQNNAPIEFLSKNQRKLIYKANGDLRISLYKTLLFISIFNAIKAGQLTLKDSYQYLSLDEYLIDVSTWEVHKEALLKKYGLESIKDFKKVIKKLKKRLSQLYDETNQNYFSGENSYLKLDKNNKVIITTPKVDKPDLMKVSELLAPCKYTSIIKVLSSIHKITNFGECFKHYSIKHKKGKPSIESFFAGVLGLGCNIGVSKIADTSKGISANELSHIVTWYFSMDNINAANDRVINFINKLTLPTLFKKDINLLHTSSDGQKKVVSADSLNANFSFKYLGHDKGVSIYTFIDEKCVLFHSTVISSSDREAGYVIDGLLCNEEIKSDIHSTDTHGFSEVVFSLTHLLGVTFAPRIAKVKRQIK